MTLVSAHVRVYNASVGQLYNSEELTSCQKICCRSFLWWSKDFRRKAASCRACEILHIGKPNFIKRRYEEGASTDPPACCWSFFHVYKSTNEQDLPVRKSYEHLIFHNLWLTTCQTLTWVFWWATMIHRSELWLLQDSVFFCRFCVWCFCSLEPPASLCCVLPWALHALNQRSSAKICQSNKNWFIKISGTQLNHSKHNHNDAYWLL